MSYVAPPGWPREVRPPDSPDWEHTATSWLLDHCPPEYRSYQVLRRHLVVLVRFAKLHVDGGHEAAQRGLGEVRAALKEVAEPETVEAAVVTWERELARLVALRRAIGLLEEAVRGRRFAARL